jgi:hypothetical protein
MPDNFPDDKELAIALLQTARAQSKAMTDYAVNAWRRPYNELFAFYDRLLSEPPSPVQEWPARAATAGIVGTYKALEYQYASMRALLKAMEGAFPQTRDCILIDRESEAAGPIELTPLVPVVDAAALRKPHLSCPGAGVIPPECIDIQVADGKLRFRLVGLTNGGPQPLALGTYTGDLLNSDGHAVALLKVQVVDSVP